MHKQYATVACVRQYFNRLTTYGEAFGPGCREPSPGKKHAGSWPFGLPSLSPPRLQALRASLAKIASGGQG